MWRSGERDTRRAILKAAEELLAESDVDSLTVRAIAGRAGMTDMGVVHHFGSRDELVLTLVNHVGAGIQAELSNLASEWVQNGASLDVLVERLSDFYEVRGRLMIAVHRAGWRSKALPVLEPVVEKLHAARLRQRGAGADRDDTRLAVSAMHLGLALEHAFGFEFRRTAGFVDFDAGNAAQRRWWSLTMAERLGISG